MGGAYIGNSEFPEHTTTTFPSNLQLDKLTHVIAADIGCRNNGSLFTGKLPNFWQGTPPPNNIWNGSKNQWLVSLIGRAHAKGVNVSISLGGDYFPLATNDTNINAFVGNIASFVNVHGFNGVNVNWEYPTNATQWNQCIALLQSLKNNLPLKRITIALSHSRHVYNNYTHVPQQILSIADGIYLMTYDEGDPAWPNHSDTTRSIKAINEWISWGTPTCEQKKKLFMGCAFYGWKPFIGDQQGGERVSYRDYINFGPSAWTHRGDLPADVENKAIHTRDNGFGGVFIWELGFDVPTNQSNSLLKAIHEVMPYVSGPTLVCNSNTDFTLHNPPNGSTISWSKSSNLTDVSGQGTTQYRVRAANSVTSGSGWVQATIKGSCDSVQLRRHDVWVGKPTLPTVNPGKGIQMTISDDLRLVLTNTPGASSSSGQWSASGVLYPSYSGYTSGTECFFSADAPGTGQAMVTTSNVCGSSPVKYVYVLVQDIGGGNGGGPLTIAPNPASNEINLIFDEQQNINSENNISLDVEMHYSVRIMNNFGLVFYSGNMDSNSMKINISNWEKGFYHVFITNNQDSFSSTFIVN